MDRQDKNGNREEAEWLEQPEEDCWVRTELWAIRRCFKVEMFTSTACLMLCWCVRHEHAHLKQCRNEEVLLCVPGHLQPQQQTAL